MKSSLLTFYDKLILLVLCLVALAGIGVGGAVKNNVAENLYVEIRVDSKIVREVALSDEYQTVKAVREYLVETPEGYNKVKVEGSEVSISETDCKDEYCRHYGKISKPYQQIVCLPHKLLVTLLPLDSSVRSQGMVDTVIR